MHQIVHPFNHGGPFQIPQLEQYLFIERFRNSSGYLKSWQRGWRILWMRPKLKTCLNIQKLAEKLVDGRYQQPVLYRCCRLYDVSRESSILSLEMDENESCQQIKNVGEFLNYA